jgi:hypothetical protein
MTAISICNNIMSESQSSSTLETDEEIDGEVPRQGYGAKQLAHRNAQQRDLENHISPGEMIEVYIRTPPERNGGEEAVGVYSRGEVQDVRVFIDPGQHQSSLS